MPAGNLVLAVVLGTGCLAVGACRSTPPPVLVDETVRPHPEGIGCTDDREALTYKERIQVEQVVYRLASKLSASKIPVLRVRVVCSDTLDELAATANDTVYVSARTVRRLLGHRDRYWREHALAFLIGHEIGHLGSPACREPCAEAFECERRADEVAIMLAGDYYGSILLAAASRSHAELRAEITDLRAQLASARAASFCSAGNCADPSLEPSFRRVAMSCLANSALELRDIVAVEQGAKQGARNWEGRRRLHEQIAEVERRRRKLATDLDACGGIVDLLPADSTRACLIGRVEAVRAALVHASEVPDLTSPRWRSPISRWHDDAVVQASLDIAPSWWISIPDRGDATLLSRHPATGGMTRLFVGYEGGLDESAGVRFGYGRSNYVADTNSIEPIASTSYSAELAADKPVWLIGSRLGLLSSVGVGLSYHRSSRDPGVGFLVHVGLRLAVRIASRLHVAAGVELGLDTNGPGQEESPQPLQVSVPLTLDLHLGRY